jgi:hypothetical protein
MFFERGSYDPESVAEGRARLSQFQGATAISSNQYFGREEEDMVAEGADGGLLGDGSLAGLETAARDAVTRLMANPDVQNLGDNLRSGALKVCDRSLMRDGNVWRTNAGCCVAHCSSRTIWHRCQNADFGGTEQGICGWDGKEVVSEGTFVVCHPGLDDPVPVQLCAENLIPRMSTFFIPIP